MSKGIKVMERKRMRLRTDAKLIAISPELIGRGDKNHVKTVKTTISKTKILPLLKIKQLESDKKNLKNENQIKWRN